MNARKIDFAANGRDAQLPGHHSSNGVISQVPAQRSGIRCRTRPGHENIALDKIFRTPSDLPVVPLCRTQPRLPCELDTLHLRVVPRSSRGALRDRHERWVRDAMDATARRTNAAARGRRSRVVLMPRRWHQVGGDASRVVASDGDKKARSPKRARRKPLKPFARGKPDLPDRTCGDFSSCAFLFLRTRLRVRNRHPAFPAPSPRERLAFVAIPGGERLRTRTDQGREIADACSGSKIVLDQI